MKVLLLFPPSGDVFQPYISITHLTAVLIQKGIPVEQRDLNIEFFNYFTSPQLTEASYKKLRFFLREFERNPGTSAFEAARYHRYAPYRNRKKILMNSTKAGAQLRKDFNCYRTTADCIFLLQEVLTLNSFPYFPTRVRLSKGNDTGPYSYRQEQDAAAFTDDKRRNPYLGFFREIVPSIIKTSPGIIGISVCFNTQILAAFTLARVLRKNGFSGHICVGGAAVTQLEDRLSQSPRLLSFIDSAVIGEGEYALPELVEALSGKKDLRQVSNLLYWNDSRTKLLRSQHNSYVADMDQLPPPSLSGLNLDNYLSPETVLLYAPTRGCYWNRCVFCSYGLTSATTARYRERSSEMIVDDLEYLQKKYNIRHFTFSVDCIVPETLARVSQGIIKRKLDIRWQVDLRLEPTLTRERLELFAQAGCVSIMFGLESACQRVLNVMDKGIKMDTVKRTLANIDRAGIASVLMIICGFPTETEAEANETKNFLITNSKYISSVGPGVFGLLCNSRVAKSPSIFAVDSIVMPADGYLGFDYPEYSVSEGMSQKKKNRVFKMIHREFAKYFPVDFYPFSGQGQSAHTLLWLEKRGPAFAKHLMKKEKNSAALLQTRKRAGKTRFTAGNTIVSLSTDMELITTPFDLLSFPAMPDSANQKKSRKIFHSEFVAPKLHPGEKILYHLRKEEYYCLYGNAARLLDFLKHPISLDDIFNLTNNEAVKKWLLKYIRFCHKKGLLTLRENRERS